MSDYRDVETLLAEIRARRQKLQSERSTEKKDMKVALRSSETEPQRVGFVLESSPNPAIEAQSTPQPSSEPLRHKQQDALSDPASQVHQSSPESVWYEQNISAVPPMAAEPSKEGVPHRTQWKCITQSAVYRRFSEFCCRYPLVVFTVLLFLACGICGWYVLSELKKFGI